MKTQSLSGSALMVGVIHRRHCRQGEALGRPCKNWTRMALIIPCADIEEDGGPGLAAVPACSEHIEQGLLEITRVLAGKP